MKLVQKGNRQLRIQDDRLDAMLAVGFVEVDEKTGKLLKKETAVDETKALKKENASLKKEVKELTQKVAELTEQLTPCNVGPGAGKG